MWCGPLAARAGGDGVEFAVCRGSGVGTRVASCAALPDGGATVVVRHAPERLSESGAVASRGGDRAFVRRRNTDVSTVVSSEAVRQIVDDGVARYFRSRHDRVDAFVDDCFSLSGTLALHRRALGLDVLRAPANILLMPVAAVVRFTAFLARNAGAASLAARLRSRPILLRTAVDREIAWRIHTELLELPYRDGDRVFARDALAEEILCDPALTAVFDDERWPPGDREQDVRVHPRLSEAVCAYAASRSATSELSVAAAALGAGAIVAHSFTPTALSLGPTLAGTVAHQAAVSGFPLGPALGGVWYGLFPVHPSLFMSVVVTGMLLGVVSIAAAFSGVVTDPLQRRLGLHRRRLRRMLSSLEASCTEPDSGEFTAREQYVLRLLDVVEVARLLHRGLA